MKICPICETENEDGAKNCSLCGESLAIPQTDGAATDPGMPGAPEVPSPPAEDQPVSVLDPASIPGPEEFGLEKWPTELESQPPPEEAAPAPAPSSMNLPDPDPGLVSPPSPGGAPIPATAPESFGGAVPDYPPPPRAVAEAAPSRAVTRPPEAPAAAPDSPPPSAPAAGADRPPPGTLCLIVYVDRKPAYHYPIVYDETLLGRRDPLSNAYPDLDLTPFDPELAISRKHGYIYREGDKHYLYPISNSGTQMNKEMIEMGTKRELTEGDVIILSGRLAMKFERT